MTGRRLVATRLSDIPMEAPPWSHYPHCPHCSRRIVSESPEDTYRASGRRLAPFNGHACPYCHEEVAS